MIDKNLFKQKFYMLCAAFPNARLNEDTLSVYYGYISGEMTEESYVKAVDFFIKTGTKFPYVSEFLSFGSSQNRRSHPAGYGVMGYFAATYRQFFTDRYTPEDNDLDIACEMYLAYGDGLKSIIYFYLNFERLDEVFWSIRPRNLGNFKKYINEIVQAMAIYERGNSEPVKSPQ